jgi:endonuclease G, mitochondrial
MNFPLNAKSEGVQATMAKSKLESIEQQALARYQQLKKEREGKPEAERIIHKSGLLPVAYLEAGSKASRAVCRIALKNGDGQIQGYGTGFLVAPTLLLTNNHILDTAESAMHAVAEFNYEDDGNDIPREAEEFRLEPDKFFFTDETLDFTLVAVQAADKSGARLSDFGYLPLLPQKGNMLEGEYVSIIQHPHGGPKAVTVRENEVRFLSPDFIHYVSDTERGSSGSPVFNDQWVVVALHHAAVPDPEDDARSIANEGIKVSSIVAFLAEQRNSLNVIDPHNLLDQLFPDASASAVEAAALEVGTLEEDWYSGVSGYDPVFLGNEFAVPLPVLTAEIEQDLAQTKDGKAVLDYTHFSIAMSKSRRLAFYTAVNINGNELVEVKRGSDKWYFDPRMEEAYQSGPELYEKNDLDRGHLTRRQDPNWGIDAVRANEHTFHFTNCAPQHKNFNQKIWLGLEDYILQHAATHGLKATVFTGPVFKEDDLLYRDEFRIPAEFWKVAVMIKEDNTLSATAYLQTQQDLIGNLEFAYGDYETYQVPIKQIETLAKLDFGELALHDALAKSGTAKRFAIASYKYIQF